MTSAKRGKICEADYVILIDISRPKTEPEKVTIIDKQIITTFEEAVDYLYNVPRFTTKNTIEDTRAFLHRLDDPDKKMKIIHVAGTNGKGSVCAYLRYILEEAGYSVNMFTSPHLVDIRERFIISGKMVSKETFLSAFLKIYEMLDWEMIKNGTGYHPTFFEYIFFMGMIIFSENPTDYCILETGLGGRLDATNSISKKELSIITRISLDHVRYLGDTVEKIAYEKAGIICKEAPVVYLDFDENISQVFIDKANELGTEAVAVSKTDYELLGIENKTIDFSLHTRYYGYVGLTLNTKAGYQVENASLAVKGIELLDKGQKISIDAIKKGVFNCFWKGRMEEILPEVYLDGAHNEDGIRAFLETVKSDSFKGKRKLLFGVMRDKDYTAMIREIEETSLFEEINLTKPKSERAMNADSLKELLEQYQNEGVSLTSCKAYEDVREALDDLLPLNDNERLYIAGSLYLVGEVLKEIED